MIPKATATKLTKLADHLENLPKRVKFNMKYWKVVPRERNVCGTTACAFGSGVIAGIFPDFKFVRLARDDFYLSSIGAKVVRYSIVHKKTGHAHLKGISTGLGLDNRDALYLFDPAMYYNPRRRNVISRLRRFVRENT